MSSSTHPAATVEVEEHLHLFLEEVARTVNDAIEQVSDARIIAQTSLADSAESLVTRADDLASIADHHRTITREQSDYAARARQAADTAAESLRTMTRQHREALDALRDDHAQTISDAMQATSALLSGRLDHYRDLFETTLDEVSSSTADNVEVALAGAVERLTAGSVAAFDQMKADIAQFRAETSEYLTSVEEAQADTLRDATNTLADTATERLEDVTTRLTDEMRRNLVPVAAILAAHTDESKAAAAETGAALRGTIEAGLADVAGKVDAATTRMTAAAASSTTNAEEAVTDFVTHASATLDDVTGRVAATVKGIEESDVASRQALVSVINDGLTDLGDAVNGQLVGVNETVTDAVARSTRAQEALEDSVREGLSGIDQTLSTSADRIDASASAVVDAASNLVTSNEQVLTDVSVAVAEQVTKLDKHVLAATSAMVESTAKVQGRLAEAVTGLTATSESTSEAATALHQAAQDVVAARDDATAAIASGFEDTLGEMRTIAELFAADRGELDRRSDEQAALLSTLRETLTAIADTQTLQSTTAEESVEQLAAADEQLRDLLDQFGQQVAEATAATTALGTLPQETTEAVAAHVDAALDDLLAEVVAAVEHQTSTVTAHTTVMQDTTEGLRTAVAAALATFRDASADHLAGMEVVNDRYSTQTAALVEAQTGVTVALEGVEGAVTTAADRIAEDTDELVGTVENLLNQHLTVLDETAAALPGQVSEAAADVVAETLNGRLDDIAEHVDDVRVQTVADVQSIGTLVAGQVATSVETYLSRLERFEQAQAVRDEELVQAAFDRAVAVPVEIDVDDLVAEVTERVAESVRTDLADLTAKLDSLTDAVAALAARPAAHAAAHQSTARPRTSQRREAPVRRRKVVDGPEMVRAHVLKVSGVGPAKSDRIAAEYPTLRRLRAASVEDIASIEGFTVATAKRIVEAVR